MLSNMNALRNSLKYYQFLSSRLLYKKIEFAQMNGIRKMSDFNKNSSITTRSISVSVPQPQKDELEVTFIRASGEKVKAKGKIGDTLLDVIVNNNLDFDGFGACEGTLTCSTCHLIFKPEDYQKLPEKPSDEEADMLDLAYDLTDTSRLGCQITLTKDMNGLEIRVPATINDARST